MSNDKQHDDVYVVVEYNGPVATFVETEDVDGRGLGFPVEEHPKAPGLHRIRIPRTKAEPVATDREAAIEVTEAQVEAVAKVMFEPPSLGEGKYSWAQMVREDPSRADLWRNDARAALEAAASVTAEPTPGVFEAMGLPPVPPFPAIRVTDTDPEKGGE